MNTTKTVTGEGDAPRKHPSLAWSPYMEKARLIATDSHLSNDAGVIARLLLAKAQCDELLAAIMGLRRAWIAPHRFSIRQAEEQLMLVSDSIAPNYKFNESAIAKAEHNNQ